MAVPRQAYNCAYHIALAVYNLHTTTKLGEFICGTQCLVNENALKTSQKIADYVRVFHDFSDFVRKP